MSKENGIAKIMTKKVDCGLDYVFILHSDAEKLRYALDNGPSASYNENNTFNVRNFSRTARGDKNLCYRKEIELCLTRTNPRI